MFVNLGLVVQTTVSLASDYKTTYQNLILNKSKKTTEKNTIRKSLIIKKDFIKNI